MRYGELIDDERATKSHAVCGVADESRGAPLVALAQSATGRSEVPTAGAARTVIADFLCDEAMLIVEWMDRSMASDIRVVMQSNYDLLQNTDRVLDSYLRGSAAAPEGPLIRPCGPPSPQGERGARAAARSQQR